MSQYSWANEEHTSLKLEVDGRVLFIPTDEGNRHYQEFLRSGETPVEYYAPAPGRQPTAEEKLAAAGLSLDELKGLLGL